MKGDLGESNICDGVESFIYAPSGATLLAAHCAEGIYLQLLTRRPMINKFTKTQHPIPPGTFRQDASCPVSFTDLDKECCPLERLIV